MNKILLTCILVGSWEFAGTVNAPQFGNAVSEVLAVYLCPHPGTTTPAAVGEAPKPPSIGVQVLRSMTLGDKPIQVAPEYFCYDQAGKLLDGTWRCPGLPSYESRDMSYRATPGWAGYGGRP